MAGYTRQSVADIINGANITAPPLNAEFNQLSAAFNATTGHIHDGSTGNAPRIPLGTSVSGYLLQENGGVGGRNNVLATSDPTQTADANVGYAPGSLWLNTSTGRVYICTANAPNAAVWVEAVGIAGGTQILPQLTATVDIGSSTFKFKNIFLSGGVDANTIVAATATVNTLNVSTASTFSATPTFNAGITVNGASNLNGNVTITGNTQLGDATSDTINFVGRVASAIVPSTDNTRDLGSPSLEFRDLYIDGTANIDSLNADTADINGGTIDNTVIGSINPSTGTFTSIAGQSLSVAGDVTIGDTSADSVALNAEVTTSIVPKTDNAVDLGSATKEFRNLFIDGTANIDSLVADSVSIAGGSINGTTIGAVTASPGTFTNLTVTGNAILGSTVDINGGNIDGTIIGAVSPTTIAGTTITATTGFTGNLTGNVTGNVTGNLTGNVSGNVTGNVAGDIDSSGTSTFQNVTINGTLNMNLGTTATITGLSAPVGPTDAATKQYVDTSVSDLIDAAPGALDTLNELAAALGDDQNFATNVYSAIATKVSKAGDTMTGPLAMSNQKITGLGTPTASADAATKSYVDTQDALKVSKAGDTMTGSLSMSGNKVTGVGAPTATGDATNKGYVDGILGSATAAADSAAAALQSEINAASSASQAASSASAAASSASAAATSESNAADSATQAANSATASANSATASANSATQSANSATASATSATNSANSASASATSASQSATSAGEAAASASAAATSEANAAASAAAAATFDPALFVEKAGDTMTGNLVVETGGSSQVHAKGATFGILRASSDSGRDFQMVALPSTDPSTPGGIALADNTAGVRRVVVDATGKMAVGKNIPEADLDVNGTLKADYIIAGNILTTSSFTWDSATSSPAAVSGGPTAPVVTPVHEQMRGCVLNNDGTVNYYLDPTNWALKDDGTSSTLTGADGNVMVEVPKFWYQLIYVTTKPTWRISSMEASGYRLHPAFIKDGVEVDFRYYSAYDACYLDATDSTYKSGLNLDDMTGNIDFANDKLASVKGAYPLVGITRDEARTLAENVGPGWRQLDYDLVAAVQMLFVVEYQTFYSQAVLGAGNTNGSYIAGSANQNDSPHTVAGAGDSIGNGSTDPVTGAGVSAKPGTSFMKYRGIENFYGNCWNWADGINVNVGTLGTVYVTNNAADWVDGTTTNYKLIADNLPTASGYIRDVIDDIPYFLPSSNSGASSSTYLTDYHYASTATSRVVRVGGSALSGADAGAFWLSSGDSASFSARNFGARLAF